MAYPNIVLKDKTGNPGAFEGIDTIVAPGHNADGVAEDIVFKKFVAGVSDGKLRMTSGTFDIPGTLYLDSGTPNDDEWSFDSFGNWKIQKSGLPAPLYLQENEWRTYLYDCYGPGSVVCREFSNYSKYGHCYVIGNEGLATGDYNYIANSGALFEVIYQLDTGLTTIIIARSPINTAAADSGKIRESRKARLRLFETPEAFRDITFEHGGQQKPDAVFLFVNGYLSYSALNEFKVAAWGLKSSLSGITSDNTVSGYISGCAGNHDTINSLDYDVENMDRKHTLHCPDDTTVKISGTFAIGVQYRWFAFWGLTDETT